MAEILAGFADPVHAAQAQFRAILDAMSRPGRVLPVAGDLPAAPAPLTRAAYATLLALCDFETPLWLDPAADSDTVRASLRFHAGCPLVDDSARAAFALVADAVALPPLATFAQGEPDYPDRSTTVILQVASLDDGPALTLRGPGIDGTTTARIAGLPPGFALDWARNRKGFPLGVDLILATDDRLLGLPRTVEIVS